MLRPTQRLTPLASGNQGRYGSDFFGDRKDYVICGDSDHESVPLRQFVRNDDLLRSARNNGYTHFALEAPVMLQKLVNGYQNNIIPFKIFEHLLSNKKYTKMDLPDAKEWAEITRQCKKHNIKMIFADTCEGLRFRHAPVMFRHRASKAGNISIIQNIENQISDKDKVVMFIGSAHVGPLKEVISDIGKTSAVIHLFENELQSRNQPTLHEKFMNEIFQNNPPPNQVDTFKTGEGFITSTCTFIPALDKSSDVIGLQAQAPSGKPRRSIHS